MHLNFLDTSTPTGFRVMFTQQTFGMQSRQTASGANPYKYSGSVFAASGANCVHAQHAECMHSKHVEVILEGEKLMTKRDVRYPHTVGFRVTDETWFRIVQEVAETDLTPHDWCRMAVLDRPGSRVWIFEERAPYIPSDCAHSILRCIGFSDACR
jgi:hypothetical protein